MKYLVTFTKPSGHQIEPTTDVAIHTVDAANPTDAVLAAIKVREFQGAPKDDWNGIYVRKS